MPWHLWLFHIIIELMLFDKISILNFALCLDLTKCLKREHLQNHLERRGKKFRKMIYLKHLMRKLRCNVFLFINSCFELMSCKLIALAVQIRAIVLNLNVRTDSFNIILFLHHDIFLVSVRQKRTRRN